MICSEPDEIKPALKGTIVIIVGSNCFKMMFAKPAEIEPALEGKIVIIVGSN
jgi:hypothetical protein